MDKNTQILVGVAAVAAVGAGYYFLVYKPQKDKEDKEAEDAKKKALLPQTTQSLQVPGGQRIDTALASSALGGPQAPAPTDRSVSLRSLARARVATPRPSPAPTADSGAQGTTQKTGGSYKIPFVGGVSWGADADVTFDPATLSLHAGGDATIAVLDASDNTIGAYRLAQGQSIGVADIIRSAMSR